MKDLIIDNNIAYLEKESKDWFRVRISAHASYTNTDRDDLYQKIIEWCVDNCIKKFSFYIQSKATKINPKLKDYIDIDDYEKMELDEKISQTGDGAWVDNLIIYFENEADCIHFKLVWS